MKLDTLKCIKCGQCQLVCPIGIFGNNDAQGVPIINKQIVTNCLGCGHCMAVCLPMAIHLDKFSYDNMKKSKAGGIIQKDVMNEYIKNRRSVRNNKVAIIRDELFRELLDTVEWVSSAHNQHAVKWKIIKGKHKVMKITAEIIKVLEVDVRFHDLVEKYKNGNNPLTRNASHILIAYMPEDSLIPVEDGTVAMSYVEMIAPSYGLASCWAGYLTIAATLIPKINEILEIPSGCIVVASLLIGYEGERIYRLIPQRKKADISYIL